VSHPLPMPPVGLLTRAVLSPTIQRAAWAADDAPVAPQSAGFDLFAALMTLPVMAGGFESGSRSQRALLLQFPVMDEQDLTLMDFVEASQAAGFRPGAETSDASARTVMDGAMDNTKYIHTPAALIKAESQEGSTP